MLFEEVKQSNSRCKTYAYFYVSDFAGEASEITCKLGLEPTKTWLKGDAWLPNKPRAFSCWELYSPVDCAEIFLDTHLKAILDIIEPKRTQILELREQGYSIGINCVGYYYDAHPGFNLSAELLSRLSTFSMDIDFDLYCLCAEDSKELNI